MTAAGHQRAAGASDGGGAIVRGARTLHRRLRAIPLPLALVTAAAAILAVGWAMVLPPFQGPDESEHFAYVQHLAETGGPPSPTEYAGAGSHSSEQTFAMDVLGLRVLMGSRDARPMWNDVDQARWRQFENDVTPAQRGDGEGLNPLAKNPPLYYAYEAAAYRLSPDTSLWGRLFATRMANVLLFLATVVFVWLAAAELTARVWARTLAAGVVALQPQLVSMAGIVNADTLLVTVWSAFVALAIRTLRRGPSARRIVGLSALAAASALTHGRGIALLPPLAIVIALAYVKHRPVRRDALRWSGAAVALLGVALVAFRLFAASRGGGLYGTQTDYVNQGGFDLLQFLSTVWQFYFPPLGPFDQSIAPQFGFRQMYVETFYGAFGWLEVRFPNLVYDGLQWASVLGLGALALFAVLRRRMLRERWAIALGLLAIGGSLWALLHLVSYLALLGSPDPLIVGRYLLPLVSLFALAITFVATSLPRRIAPFFVAGVLTVGVLLQLSGLAMTAERFYG